MFCFLKQNYERYTTSKNHIFFVKIHLKEVDSKQVLTKIFSTLYYLTALYFVLHSFSLTCIITNMIPVYRTLQNK